MTAALTSFAGPTLICLAIRACNVVVRLICCCCHTVRFALPFAGGAGFVEDSVRRIACTTFKARDGPHREPPAGSPIRTRSPLPFHLFYSLVPAPSDATWVAPPLKAPPGSPIRTRLPSNLFYSSVPAPAPATWVAQHLKLRQAPGPAGPKRDAGHRSCHARRALKPASSEEASRREPPSGSPIRTRPIRIRSETI